MFWECIKRETFIGTWRERGWERKRTRKRKRKRERKRAREGVGDGEREKMSEASRTERDPNMAIWHEVYFLPFE